MGAFGLRGGEEYHGLCGQVSVGPTYGQIGAIEDAAVRVQEVPGTKPHIIHGPSFIQLIKFVQFDKRLHHVCLPNAPAQRSSQSDVSIPEYDVRSALP